MEGALNGMTYKSLKPYRRDNITISIFDGESGECLDNGMQSKKTMRSGCFRSQVYIENNYTLHYNLWRFIIKTTLSV